MRPKLRWSVTAAVLVGVVVVWWSWSGYVTEHHTRRAPSSSAAAGAPSTSVAPEPSRVLSPDENDQNSRVVSASSPRVQSPIPFYPIRDDPGAEAHIKAAEPLERILTPISTEDQQWMERYQYPQLADIQTADWRELEKQWETMPPDGRPSGQNRHTYVANVLAAAKYRAGDPTWREWAERATGSPFSRALLLADAAERFKLNPRDQDALRDLNYWWPRAFAMGERAYAIQLAGQAARLPGFYQGYYRLSPDDAMAGIAEIENINAYRQSRGLPPMTFEPRPAASWTLWGSIMNVQPGTRPGP